MLLETVTSLSISSWCVLLLLLLLLLWRLSSPSHPNLPPSPSGALPFIGHMYLVKADPRQQFRKWREELGDVFSLRFGPRTMVVLNGYQTIKEALVKQADIFSDRPSNTYIAHKLPDNTYGILNSSGSIWKTQRTTSLNILRSFGMGKNILAERISEEVDIFIKELAKAKGKPEDLRRVANVSVSNVICAIIFGQRFEFDDPSFVRMMSLFNQVVSRVSSVNILNYFPWLEKIPFDPFKSKELISIFEELRSFVRKIVDTRSTQYDPDNLDNFIVAYMDEMKKSEKNGNKINLNEINLIRVIDNLFVAGTETTSTTLLWCILFFLHYPKVQEKAYQEIVREVGSDRAPNMSDKPNLKYLNAVIMETQRLASILPLNLAHLCTQDTTINGYHIPKGTTILPSLDSVLLDKEIWGDPDVFRPERFLDQEGNLVKREELVPFSMGRRLCLGEGLAKMELFLYLSSMVQKFKFVPPEPDNKPPIKAVWGVTCPPDYYSVRCVARIAA